MKLICVDCGRTTIDVPVADIVGKRPGKTVLVTGGMDGDEYASIEACYRVIERITSLDIVGRLIVIPVVNSPGFWAETSVNPLDGSYLKFAGVGKVNGTPTQRLVHWLVDTYAKDADLWLDLHGGTRTETIATYLWGWQTKNANIDSFATQFIADYSPHFGIFEQQRFPIGKAATLARMGCAYILGESGGSGRRMEEDVHQHEVWIWSALNEMDIMKLPGTVWQDTKSSGIYDVPAQSSHKSASVMYHNVTIIRCRKPGLWYPVNVSLRIAEKGEPLGHIRPLDGKGTEIICAPRSGQLLWIKDGLRALPTETLAAIAHTR